MVDNVKVDDQDRIVDCVVLGANRRSTNKDRRSAVVLFFDVRVNNQYRVVDDISGDRLDTGYSAMIFTEVPNVTLCL